MRTLMLTRKRTFGLAQTVTAKWCTYHIADIVKDMEEAEVMMADLYEAFKQYYSQLELQAV